MQQIQLKKIVRKSENDKENGHYFLIKSYIFIVSKARKSRVSNKGQKIASTSDFKYNKQSEPEISEEKELILCVCFIWCALCDLIQSSSLAKMREEEEENVCAPK